MSRDLQRGNGAGRDGKESCLEESVKEMRNSWVGGWSKRMDGRQHRPLRGEDGGWAPFVNRCLNVYWTLSEGPCGGGGGGPGNPEVLIGQRWDMCWRRNGRIPGYFRTPLIFTNSFFTSKAHSPILICLRFGCCFDFESWCIARAPWTGNAPAPFTHWDYGSAPHAL